MNRPIYLFFIKIWQCLIKMIIRPLQVYVVKQENIIPKSVNYHYTRKCNYTCGFCFHTARTSDFLTLDEAKKGLRMLKIAGEHGFYLDKLSTFSGPWNKCNFPCYFNLVVGLACGCSPGIAKIDNPMGWGSHFCELIYLLVLLPTSCDSATSTT